MGRLLKYFFVGFLAGFALFFAAFAFFYGVKQGAVMASVAGFVYALFCVGFMARLMKTQVLEVNTSNRDPEKGMDWYADEIRQQVKQMRFKQVGKGKEIEVFHPTGLYRVWERKVELSAGPYEVKVKASRFMIRVLSDLVEIKPMPLD